MKRIAVFLAALLIYILPVSAEETLPEEYFDFSSSLPEDVASQLPEGFFSGDISELSDSLFDVTSPKYIIGVIFDTLSGGLGGAFSLFALLVAMLALASLLSAFTEGLIAGELKGAVNYAISICISGAVVGLQVGRIGAVSEFFKRLIILMNSLIPIMGALYLSGGNTMGAALASSSLLVQINLIELAVSSIVIPAVSACLALTLADSLVSGESRLSGISGSIKRTLAQPSHSSASASTMSPR